MSYNIEKQTQEGPPTHAQIMEERFIANVQAALKAWREAGKPHKR